MATEKPSEMSFYAQMNIFVGITQPFGLHGGNDGVNTYETQEFNLSWIKSSTILLKGVAGIKDLHKTNCIRSTIRMV